LAGKHSSIHSEQLQSNGKLYFYERYAEKRRKGNFSGRNSNKRFPPPETVNSEKVGRCVFIPLHPCKQQNNNIERRRKITSFAKKRQN
jgi:hypothetical protein